MPTYRPVSISNVAERFQVARPKKRKVAGIKKYKKVGDGNEQVVYGCYLEFDRLFGRLEELISPPIAILVISTATLSGVN